jgi:hypothetical protein
LIDRARRRALGAGALLPLVANASAQLDASAAVQDALTRRVTPAAMREDIDVLARAYRALHPGLYRYQTPAAFDEQLARLHAWAGDERSLAAWYTALARLTAAVRCGHSYPNPANQGRSVRDALAGAMRPLPLHTRWIDGRLFVSDGLKTSLMAGVEILALDGVRTAELGPQLLQLARADGSNDAKRWSLLELRGNERVPTFDLYRSLLRPAAADSLQIQVRRADGTVRELGLSSAPAEGRSGLALAWQFAIDHEGNATMRMPTWALYDNAFDWRAWIDAAVDRLIDERARALVVDLRGNEGGRDCGDVLLERLIDGPVAKPLPRRLVRYRSVPADLNNMLDTWDDSFRDWGDKAVGPMDNGFYRLVDGVESQVLPRGQRFTGPVAVLIDASNSSATFQFAALVRASARGLLVGETTGGSLRGLNGGAYFFLRLPVTRVEVDVPLIGFFPASPQRDEGVVPDVPVPSRVADLTSKEDRVLHAARVRVLSS